MFSAMADLLLLVLSIAGILLLITAFDRMSAFPLLNPSRHEVRDLLVAVQDLLLPMGSFPSNLLHPWAQTTGTCRSNHTALPLPPKVTFLEDGSEPTVMPRSIEPISDDSASKPTATPASTESTSSESGPKPIAMPHPTEPTPVDAGLNPTTVPSPAESIPDDCLSFGSEDFADEPFLDSLEYQDKSDDDTQIAGSSYEMSLPEQEAAKIDSLGSTSGVVDDEEKQQEEESSATVEDVLTESQAFEKAIRELVDPGGEYSPDYQKTIQLIAGIMRRQEETAESLRSETVRFQRAEEDLRHGWEDKKVVFERIISGQNARLHWTQQISDELYEENETLLSENVASKEKYERTKKQYTDNLQTLNTAKRLAEQDAETARTMVEGRIDALKEKHRQENSAKDFNNRQERNTLVCQRRMVEDSLADARLQVTAAEQQHKITTKNRDGIIRELMVTVRELRSTLTTSRELTASAEQILKKQLDDQRKEKDYQIDDLKIQLRQSKDEAKKLGG